MTDRSSGPAGDPKRRRLMLPVRALRIRNRVWEIYIEVWTPVQLAVLASPLIMYSFDDQTEDPLSLRDD